MTALTEFLTAVDAFMPPRKVLIGADGPHAWQPGRDEGELCLKLPLEIGGEQRGQYLWIRAYPEHPTLKFCIGILFGRPIVCRLDFNLEAVHGNNFAPPGLGLPSLVKGPHWHSWEINRPLFVSVSSYTKLKCAVPLDAGIRKFDPALRWYCGKRNIELNQHQIALPERRRLV